jgi:hypothetical protein
MNFNLQEILGLPKLRESARTPSNPLKNYAATPDSVKKLVAYANFAIGVVNITLVSEWIASHSDKAGNFQFTTDEFWKVLMGDELCTADHS